MTHLSSGSFDYTMPSASAGLFGSLNDAAHGANSNSIVHSRRRGRGQRAVTLNGGINANRLDSGSTGSDMMDVEDENGRERKRVARR